MWTRLPRYLTPLIALAMPAYAGPFSFGVKGGASLTDFFTSASLGAPQGVFTSNTKRYIVGPTVELRLPAGFQHRIGRTL